LSPHQRERVAHRAGWPELERSDLDFQRFGHVVHEPTGDRYFVHRGELVDERSPIAAYFYDQLGGVVYLESIA
jgi:hypothetical protein